MESASGYRKLFDDFCNLNVMVIGDVMVDSYLWGKVDRISPEAPIPVVALRKRENRMGGAANVAMNLKALGANPVLCSVIGDDEKGDRFIELMEQEKIPTMGIVKSNERVTTTKFRIFGNTYQMLRVDEETDEPLTPADEHNLVQCIDRVFSSMKIDCIILQDYDKGVLGPDLIAQVVRRAENHGIPVTVDPKKRNFLAYRGVTLFKPNLKELREGLGIKGETDSQPAIEQAVRLLADRLGCRYVLATLSERGVVISCREGQDDKFIHIPAHLRSISDVSGAGDTVISVASLCLALGCSPHDIAYISNLAGGLVCEEVGVVPVDKRKLLEELLQLF